MLSYSIQMSPKLKNDLPEMKADIKKLFKRIFRYFLQGLLYIGPIFVILYIVYWIFIKIDGLLPFKVPGLGFVVIFAFITLVGYFGNTIIAKPLVWYFKKIIDRVPLIKTIYESVTDLLSAFVGNKKKFNVPVMVKMNKESDIYKLGFLTREDLSQLGISNTYVAVYLPHSYNFSGNMFVVPSTQVTTLNLPSSEVMKFIVSGGVIDIDENPKELTEETDSDKA